MEHRCNEIEKDLYEFKEQYAKNGKEIMRLAMAIENIINQNKEHFKTSEENRIKRLAREEEFKKELKPVLDSYHTLLTGRKWIIGLASFFLLAGAIYQMIKNLIHK